MFVYCKSLKYSGNNKIAIIALPICAILNSPNQNYIDSVYNGMKSYTVQAHFLINTYLSKELYICK